MKRQQWIVIGAFGAAFGLFIWLGWFALIKPVNKQREAKEAELKEAEAKLQEARTQAAQHEKFQALSENIKRDLALVSQRLDPVFSRSDFYGMLSAFGNTLGVSEYKWEAKPRAKTKEGGTGNLEEIPVTLTFKAGYHHVGALLTALASEQRLLVADKMTLKGNLDYQPSKPPMEAKVDMRVFLEPLPEAGK